MKEFLTIFAVVIMCLGIAKIATAFVLKFIRKRKGE